MAGTATHRVVGSLAASANLTYVPKDHEPVLAEELIDLLDPHPGETFVDCTFGGGGHARLIAERLGSDGRPRRGRSPTTRRGLCSGSGTTSLRTSSDRRPGRSESYRRE